MCCVKETDVSQISRQACKKTKVTRSVLRQNKIPFGSLSVQTADGGKKNLRISSEMTDRNDSTSDLGGHVDSKSKIDEERSSKVTRINRGSSVSKAFEVKKVKTESKKTVESSIKIARPEESIEQHLFEKTERNIAAAMKEARKGISAEQLVIRFGLSVPEAGLITSVVQPSIAVNENQSIGLKKGSARRERPVVF